MHKPRKIFLALVAWLMLAIVLSSGFGVRAESMVWWILVAPPAATLVLLLAGGFLVAITGLLLGRSGRQISRTRYSGRGWSAR